MGNHRNHGRMETLIIAASAIMVPISVGFAIAIQVSIYREDISKAKLQGYRDGWADGVTERLKEPGA
jgi:hypothetical protein